MVKRENFAFDKIATNNKVTVGIDEVGRGPLAGPVLAAAVIMPLEIEGLADSKKISAIKRDKLFIEIMSNAKVGIGSASVEEIDKINILQASMLAMKRAYDNLNCKADLVLVDGNKAPDIECIKLETIIGGDAIVPLISAASIIAKVTRDKLMQELGEEFPQYLWHKNAGYGTKAHLNALDEFGVTKHHRLTFAPVKSRLNRN
jgi:ribonuclease HII